MINTTSKLITSVIVIPMVSNLIYYWILVYIFKKKENEKINSNNQMSNESDEIKPVSVDIKHTNNNEFEIVDSHSKDSEITVEDSNENKNLSEKTDIQNKFSVFSDDDICNNLSELYKQKAKDISNNGALSLELE